MEYYSTKKIVGLPCLLEKVRYGMRKVFGNTEFLTLKSTNELKWDGTLLDKIKKDGSCYYAEDGIMIDIDMGHVYLNYNEQNY
jgi:hypothetical protein